jgi:hypothetical protein
MAHAFIETENDDPTDRSFTLDIDPTSRFRGGRTLHSR